MTLGGYKLRAFVPLIGVLALAALLVSLSGAALAQQSPASPWPVLQIANPSPGAVVPNGDYVISGSAFDPMATEGAGVSRVDLFLGDRDQGGLFLGSAVPGQDSMEGLTSGSTAATQSFQLTVALPPTINGSKEFHAYAYSALSGNVTSVSMPIYVGVSPTPMATPAAAPLANVEHLAAVPISGTMFSLGNPTAGDLLPYGDYVISGTAATPIDRVQVFVDDRDAGGTLLETTVPSDGTFTMTVKIPTTLTGGHELVAYAYASSTGQETKVSVPIYLGTAPTPTARPVSNP